MEEVRGGTVRLKRILCILIGALLLLSLIPLLWIAKYDLPARDDILTYNAGTAQVWTETHSFGAVLNAAYERTVEYYNNWQGTYFSSMLMYTLTGVLPVALYGITPFIMLLTLIASTLYTSRVLIVRYLKLDRLSWLLAALTALLFQIQLLPNITEGIFWLNTASLYTLSYCWMLLMFGFLLNANSFKSAPARIVLTILACFCAIAVGGGAFPLMIPAILITAWIFFRSIVNRDKYSAVQSGAVLMLLILGTVLSVSAPGNQARMAYEHNQYTSQGLSLFMATVRSIQCGILFAAQYTDMAMLLFCGICGVIFAEAAKRSSIRFYHPVFVFIITFGLFCMQFTPTYYTLASSGPDRLKNLIYFSLYWILAFNIFNLEGWMVRRHHAAEFMQQLRGVAAKNGAAFLRCGRKTLIILAMLLVFLAFSQRDNGFYANPSVQAAIELRTGAAALHAQQSRNNMQEGAEQIWQYESAILP